MNAEGRRLAAARSQAAPWRKWGPYLSERQWGTVREDYGTSGDAWSYLSHDSARSFAYRWGEDGIAGVSDDRQILCFALALWNGGDPILKERLFGLTNHEGNHGEDVKEYYFYLDSTPTHSYMRYLYKYPQEAFPYLDLVETNRGRSRGDREYELIDSGVFDDDRYFDVFVDYAKASPEDLLKVAGLEATSRSLGKYVLRCQAGGELLFVDNETNPERWRADAEGPPGRAPPFFKDGINDRVVGGRAGTINPRRIGTKAAAHHTGGLTAPKFHSEARRPRATVFATISPTDALKLWAPPHAPPAAASPRRPRRKTPEAERRT